MSAPYRKALEITPNDVTDLPEIARAIYVGTGGDITMVLAADSAPMLFKDVPAGTILQVMVTRVLATGTTASNLLLLR